MGLGKEYYKKIRDILIEFLIKYLLGILLGIGCFIEMIGKCWCGIEKKR